MSDHDMEGRPSGDPGNLVEGGASLGSHPPVLSPTPEDALRGRLAALDRLYESQAITLAELGEARAILSGQVDGQLTPIIGADASSVVASAAAQPASLLSATEPGSIGPPPPPAMPPADHIGPLPPPKATKILGLPVWAAAAIAGALVVAAVLAGLFLMIGGSDDSKSAAAGTPDYAGQVRAPLGLLTRSAVETGKAMGRVSQAGEVTGLHKVASRQLDAVEKARSSLAMIRVPQASRRAHAQLIRAAAFQRRYLVQLGRATAGAPTDASLRRSFKMKESPPHP